MSSRAAVFLLAALGVAAPAVRAQGALARPGVGARPGGGAAEDPDARDRRLLARAESLSAALQAKRLAAARAVPSRGSRLFRDHGLTLVVDGTAPEAEVRAAADTAAALLEELGAVPKSFLSRSLFVWSSAQDTAALLVGGAFEGWGRIQLQIPSVARQEGGKHRVVPGFAETGWPMARAALVAYAGTLDPEWQRWLPGDYGLKRTLEAGEARPWQMFAPALSAAGAGCLSGRAASCRLWLGLDRDGDPYVTRYRPSELRELFTRGYWTGSPLRRVCLAGSDPACVGFAREVRQPDPVPADASARRSLLRAAHDIYGAPALAAALIDTTGSIGQRLARATGVTEDTLVLAWRRRVLGIGGALESRAGAKEAGPALLFAGLLLLAAAGSGRWR